MDDMAGKGIDELTEKLRQEALNATDLKERSEAMKNYQIAMELKLKYDSLVDAHDENVEKIMNAQISDENKREDELKREERRFQFERRKFRFEFWKDIGKTALLLGFDIVIVVMVFLFDGRGVIFTSNVGKTTISSIVRKLFDWLKI